MPALADLANPDLVLPDLTTAPRMWVRQFGTASVDGARDVATEGAGNVYVTGGSGGALDGNQSAGGEDAFLVKYDANGNNLWTRQFGTAADDYANGVAADAKGNTYVTGGTSGGLDGNTNAGNADVFLVKYGANGNKLWTRQFGTSTNDVGVDVATDAMGNVYVTGSTSGGLDGNQNAGQQDVFLVKYDANGNKLWTRQLGTPVSDEGTGVATDGAGNAYVVGNTSGGGLDGNQNAGGYDFFLVKYDGNGNKAWTRQLGTATDDRAIGLAVDGSGGIFFTGMTQGALDGNQNAGQSDVFLVKYSTNGNKLWTRQFGTPAFDTGSGVAADEMGNLYVVGLTAGGLDGNANAGSVDFFLVTYDTNGNKLWTRQRGTADRDYAFGVAVDGSGGIYVTGWTDGAFAGNQNAGSLDVFLTRFVAP